MKFFFIHALLCSADQHILTEQLDTMHRLSAQGHTVQLVLLCDTLPSLPDDLTVLHCPTESHAFYSPQAAAAHLSSVLPASDEQSWYIFSSNLFGSTLCTLFSVHRNLPCMQQVSALQAIENTVVFKHTTHAGKIEMTFRSQSSACLSLLPSGTQPTPFAPGQPSVVLLPPCPKRTDIQEYTPSSHTVDLASAPFVWVGGRGMQSSEQFTVFRQFALPCHALTACTRPAGMNGWQPLDTLVGISGATLSADCCLVVGASGSSAFLSGIRNCSTIIAVNSDPDAEIFHFCDYKLVCTTSALLQALERYISHK